MAVTGRQLINSTEIIEIDADPTSGLGQASSIGSLAILTTTGAHYRKSGVADTAWSLTAVTSINVGVVQKRRTTAYTTTGTFTNITFDAKDVESQPSILDADPVNLDRIRIFETGLYKLTYLINTELNLSGTINLRTVINNTTVVPGSTQTIEGGDELTHVSWYSTLNAGEYVTVQAQNVGGSGTFVAGAFFTIERCSGPQGAQGAPGGSSFAVRQNGVTIASNISSVDFVGPNLVVAQPSAGVITVTAPAFGSNAAFQINDALSTTQSTTFQNKVTVSSGVVPAGNYRVGWYYNWYYTNTTRAFVGRVLLNGATSVMEHVQPPPTTATTNRVIHGGFDIVPLTAGTHTFTLDYRASNTADIAGILNARLEFWRVT